jgi:osmoprotectant transport system ATP-binding protein
MIQLNGVSKKFSSTLALARTDIAVAAGRTTVLIGPSGCGKSTLLRLIVGLIEADTGSVVFEGTSVTGSKLPEVRRRIGYVIQNGGLFPHLTAADNVTLMARYLKWDGDRVRRRLCELIELTHFPSDGLRRYPQQLSGGQRQRVSLMRALMLDPDVLLLDEPLGALDPLIRAELQEDLREIFRSLGKTVVLVTHDLGEAGFFGDTIVLLNEGTVVQEGTLRDLVEGPANAFVTRFIKAQRAPLDVLGDRGS